MMRTLAEQRRRTLSEWRHQRSALPPGAACKLTARPSAGPGGEPDLKASRGSRAQDPEHGFWRVEDTAGRPGVSKLAVSEGCEHRRLSPLGSLPQARCLLETLPALLFGVYLTLAQVACSSEAPPPTLRFEGAPVVLMSVDTLRADHLPAYGYTEVETPAIDRLRGDSVLFENAYSPCPLTLPAHVSLLTGQPPDVHGVRNNIGYRFEAADFPTLASRLSAHGYATAAAVSAYVLRARTGLGPTFGEYDDGVEYGDRRSIAGLQRPAPETVAVASAWIEEHREEPFFYFLHLFEPHSPYEPPEPFKSRYPSPYDGEIAAADAALGGFLESLRRSGVYDRALIVFLSDHGEGLGDHGEKEHGILLYREAIRVPMMVKLPGGAQAGKSVSQPVQLLDIVPTVSHLLGLPPVDGLPGRCVFHLGGETAPTASRTIYSETYYARIHLDWSELRSLVDGDYHYIDAPRPELYNLHGDPSELRDILGQRPRVSARLREELAGRSPRFRQPHEVDPQDAAGLAALGYLATPSAGEPGPRPDPKDVLPVLSEMEQAFALSAEGHLSEAIDSLNEILRRFPNMLDARLQLAKCLRGLGRFEEALAQYRSASELVPEAADEILVEITEILIDLERLSQAETQARTVLATQPSEGHQLLGRIALLRDDPDEALRHAQLAVAADRVPWPEAVLLMAQAQADLGRHEQVLLSLEGLRDRVAAGKLQPVPRLEYLHADALANLGRNDEAEQAFLAEIEAFPDHSPAYANLAVLYAAMHLFDRIEPLLENMVSARPLPETCLLAADTAERLGDTEGARAWRRRAHEM